MNTNFVPFSRRCFLHAVSAGPFALKAWADGQKKPLRGVFPIAQTPFTDSNKLDVDSLTEQLRFIHRGGVHGFVWPQLASEWSTLSESERFEGSEALCQAAKNVRPALVIGVQAASAEKAVAYARHAKKAGADAIISLPPADTKDPREIRAWYKQIGSATDLPFFVQAVGNMTVPMLLEMYREIPTFRYIKDEAGQPLFRMAPLQQGSAKELNVFTGAHGRTMIDEMKRGFAGTMPAASFADLYAQAWDSWHSGHEKAAMEMFGRVSMLISEVSVYGIESLKYILELRGVFRTHHTREKGNNSQSDLAIGFGNRLDEAGMQVIRSMMEYVKPWLKA